MVKGLAPNGTLDNIPALLKALTEYATLIKPWAQAVAQSMVAEVVRRDRKMWKTVGKELGEGVRAKLDSTPVAALYSSLQEDQVKLITSLPLEAAQRVHDLTREGLVDSRRAAEIRDQILATEDVTKARAMLIARTEVSRSASNLVQARSQWVGSEGYIWRTSKDFAVRDSHAEMEGKYVRWTEPPTLDNLKGHAGTIPNCRCFAEPVFPDDA